MNEQLKAKMHKAVMRKLLSDIGRELIKDFVIERAKKDLEEQFSDPNIRVSALLN